MKVYILFVLSFLNLYLVLSILFAKNGITDFSKLKKEKNQLTTHLQSLKQQNYTLHLKLSYLSPGLANKDFIEESAKLELNFSAPNESLFIESNS